MRAAMRAETSCETAPSKLTAKKMAAAVLTERPKRRNNQRATMDCTTNPPPNASREKSAASCRTSRRDRIRQARGKGSERAGECASEVVPGEQRGPVASRRRLGEDRLLGGQKQRDVAGRRVQRAEERDGEQRPEPGGEVERHACRAHQRRGSEQHGLPRVAVAQQSYRQQQRRRSEQGRGSDGPDLHRREAQTRQVAREQDAREPVRESPRRSRSDQPRCIGRRARRQEADHGETRKSAANAAAAAYMRGCTSRALPSRTCTAT